MSLLLWASTSFDTSLHSEKCRTTSVGRRESSEGQLNSSIVACSDECTVKINRD